MTHAELIRLAEEWCNKRITPDYDDGRESLGTQGNKIAFALLTYLKSLPVDEGKPDGFVACLGDFTETLTFVTNDAGEMAAWYLLIDEDCAGYDFSDASNPDCNETDQIERAKREGWVVKPVRLQFLDTLNKVEEKEKV